jgi:hypothetical protein
VHASMTRLLAFGCLVPALLVLACSSANPEAVPSSTTPETDAAAPMPGPEPPAPPALPRTPKDAGTPDAGGESCAKTGTFCGGHGVTGGNPNTLYICSAAGAHPV